MDKLNPYIVYAVLAVLTVLAIGGLYYPKSTNTIQQVVGAASPTGSTVTNDFIGVTMNLSAPGANGTSTSILNTSSQDRYVTAVRGGCEALGTSNTAYSGAGLANLQLTVGTTSTAAPTSVTSFFNPILAVYNIATTTTSTAFATSTTLTNSFSGSVATTSVLWASGVNLTFMVNATNTANCTFGVDYAGS